MSAREEILARLRKQARQVEMPPPWGSRRDFDDLAGRFTEKLKETGGEVVRVPSLNAAVEELDRLLHEINARSVLANHEPPVNSLPLQDRWPHIDWFIAGLSEGDLRAFATSADVGLSGGALAALAETGTIAVSSGSHSSRLTSLLPPVHIALVPGSLLTPDIFTWAALRGETPPASLTLISGPSKTADIEQTMAVGVHGPRRFIVVLYED